MYRKPYWACTVKFYFGFFSLEIPGKPILGGFGVRFNFRVYGKRYWRFKKKMAAMRERHSSVR
jgi:hypothetical protein